MTELTFLDFKCPYCGVDLSFLDTCAGTVQSCPQCQEVVVVPRNSTAAGGKVPLPINTRRLVLRRFQSSDWKDLLDVMSNEEVFRYLDSAPMDEAGVLQWLEADRGTRLMQPGQTTYLGMELRDNAKLVGQVSITCNDEARRQAGFGVIVHPNFQDCAKEAVGGLLAFGFEGINLHRLTTWSDTRDVNHRQMLEAAGLRCEGEFLKDRFVDGHWVDTAWYALLREEYEKWPKP